MHHSNVLHFNSNIVTQDQHPVGSFSYGPGRFEFTHKGIFFIAFDKEGKELPPRWICSPLSVIAKTRDAKSGEWGRLLEWHDDDQVKHQWAMPIELLQGDASEVRRELSRLGLTISPDKTARDLLVTYLQVCPIDQRARCVDRLGWYNDVFVTPFEPLQTDLKDWRPYIMTVYLSLMN